MSAGYPDYRSGIDIAQQSLAKLDIDIIAQSLGNIAIDLVTQTLANLKIDINAQTLGSVKTDIVAQTLATIKTDITAQSVGNIAVNIAQQVLSNLSIDIAASSIGNVPMEIAANTLGNIVIDIAAQSIGNVDMDIAGQTLSQINSRSKYGAAQSARYSDYILANQDNIIFDISGKGIVYSVMTTIMGDIDGRPDQVNQLIDGSDLALMSILKYVTANLTSPVPYGTWVSRIADGGTNIQINRAGGITFEAGYREYITENVGDTPLVKSTIVFALAT